MSKIDKKWELATIDLNDNDSFQLVIEIYKASGQKMFNSEQNFIGFDDFEVTHGTCNQIKNKK